MNNTNFNSELKELKERTEYTYGSCGIGWKIILHEIRQRCSENGRPYPATVIVGIKTHSNNGWSEQIIGVGFAIDGNPRIAYLDAVQNALGLLCETHIDSCGCHNDDDDLSPEENVENERGASPADNEVTDEEIEEILHELAEEEKRKAELAKT